MTSQLASHATPVDQAERTAALDPRRSILVQAPAGSGKTDLLTRRFLRLLTEVDEPGQVLAITFTNAAAAEMRHRILAELEKADLATPAPLPPRSRRQAQDSQPLLFPDLQASSAPDEPPADEFSMSALARRALQHSRMRGWKLLDLPAQLRISTIDSFCRELASQQPLLSGLGGGLDIAEQPGDLYRRAARQTLERLEPTNTVLSQSIELLLLWRDNNWQELESLLVTMLSQRDRWMHDFVLTREPDFDALRHRLERPFANAVRQGLTRLSRLLDQVPGAGSELLALARFACEQTHGKLHRDLAELAEFPHAPFAHSDELEAARRACVCLAQLLLTDGAFRQKLDARHGFPSDCKAEKARLLQAIDDLRSVPGLEAAIAATRGLPPARYSDEDWQIVRACFTVLRHAAGELQVAFAEAGRVDFTEVAQIAERALVGEDGLPTDAALAVSDGIHHLLVDEFQDTSRRQHSLLAAIVAAWPERSSRSVFLVGDPMQSIYFFRDADAELFSRVKNVGLDVAGNEPLEFEFAALRANFRTDPSLVEQLNRTFAQVFAKEDGSGIGFSSAEPHREPQPAAHRTFKLHLNFALQPAHGKQQGEDGGEAARSAQAAAIVSLIQEHLPRIEQARASGEKYRIAVLGRARAALAPVAQALREAAIPFRAVDLEKLADRPEVLDALALGRALLNPMDRVEWLGVLRAPWCGLTLDDLHRLASDDDPEILSRAVPELLRERLPLLSEPGRLAAAHVLSAADAAAGLRANRPTATLGTWLESVWLRLGGAACVDATARANLDLLWNCLDSLPAGEQDLLGPALKTALERLTALPDMSVSSDCGVQLMTIHKSKGLEFEVVIVPDLQARGAATQGKLLSWLELGLARPDESGAATEFLIAPLPPKGTDRGKAKEWVDRVYRERETQEMRRILYVAATRAREELHFFACPACKEDEEGLVRLAEPVESLLRTAWPALEEETRLRFDEWKTARRPSATEPEEVIESMAASGNLVVMRTAKPTLLRRLPLARLAEMRLAPPSAEPAPSAAVQGAQLYARHEGGPASRALGTAVHALLEQLARRRAASDWSSARAALSGFETRIAAQIRAAGIGPEEAARTAAEAMCCALAASHDPIGQWILSPHADAGSETSWTGVFANGMRSVRVDRVFRGGSMPGEPGDDCWWIVDYKTAELRPGMDVSTLRPLFAPQMKAYADLLRKLHGEAAPIRAGLYYPRMLQLDWWQIATIS